MDTFIKYLEEKIEGCEMTQAPYRDKIIYQLVLDEYKQQLLLHNVGSSGNLLKRKQEVSKSIENFKKACENYTKSKEYKDMIKAFEKLKAFR